MKGRGIHVSIFPPSYNVSTLLLQVLLLQQLPLKQSVHDTSEIQRYTIFSFLTL